MTPSTRSLSWPGPRPRPLARNGDLGPVPARELIEGILRDFPDHQPGTRPVHAFGVAANGWFRPTAGAARSTVAAPFAHPEGVAVRARFSSGTGNRGAADNRRDVRGMAVHFSGEPGDQFDLVAMTLPTFFTRTVADFQGLTRAAEPVPLARRPRWRDLVDLLNLRTPAKDPGPGDAGVLAFSAMHPEACPALVASFSAQPTESFATRAYHAVHAFRLTDAEGATCSVRFHWDPVDGVRNLATAEEHYLQDEFAGRLADAPVRFVLRAQVADHGDDTSDATRPWPQSRRRLVLGHLVLHELRPGAGEELAFDPHRLPAGIDGDPDDEIFRVRGEVYRESAAMRGAGLDRA